MTFRSPTSFSRPWQEAVTCWFDFETTNLPPHGRAVEVGFARFDGPVFVDGFSQRINPGVPIPEETTKIHGITDADVAGMPTVVEVFASERVIAIMEGAQLGAYNCSHDRLYLPANAACDHSWPMLDALVLARRVDRYETGAGKHKLQATCDRHGVALTSAHSAGADARAAAEVFFVLAEKAAKKSLVPWNATLGVLLKWTRDMQNEDWFRFVNWIDAQQKAEAVGGQVQK